MATGTACVRGSCSCKTLNWTATAYPTDVIYCWCRACRKRSGAPFVPFGDVPTAGLSWSPADKLKKAKSPNAATEFTCADCNTTLGLQYPFNKDTTSIVLGSIWCPDSLCCSTNLERMDLRPRAHVYTSQKCAWFDIPDDGAPRFEGHMPQLERQAEEWRIQRERESVRKRK